MNAARKEQWLDEISAGVTCPAGLAESQHPRDAQGVGMHGWMEGRMKVYRPNALLLAGRRTCKPPRSGGRSCERGAGQRGAFSLIGAPFALGKKICHRNLAMARTMREGFSRSAQGFMPIWGPKVTQLGGVALEPLNE